MRRSVSLGGLVQADCHNECVLAMPPALGQWFVCTMRVLCNGKTSAFQADDTGSIPVTRFITHSNIFRREVIFNDLNQYIAEL